MQLFWPIGQEHMPAAQVCPIGQAVPHEPQLALSLAVSTQVIAAPVPQTVRGAVHATAQRPVVQVCPIGQALPHMPQWVSLDCTSTHASPQRIWPVGHAHAPAVQLCPPEHAIPHAPQFVGSVCVSVQVAPQRRCPIGHEPPLSPTGVSAMGVSTTGVSTTGVSTTGVSTTGVSLTGVSTTGVSTTGTSFVPVSLSTSAPESLGGPLPGGALSPHAARLNAVMARDSHRNRKDVTFPPEL